MAGQVPLILTVVTTEGPVAVLFITQDIPNEVIDRPTKLPIPL